LKFLCFDVNIHHAGCAPVHPKSQHISSQSAMKNLIFDLGGVVFTWKPADVIAAQLPDFAATPEQARALAHAIFAHPEWQDFDRGVVELAEVTESTARRVGIAPERLHCLLGPVAERLQPIASTIALIESLSSQRAAAMHGHAREPVGVYFLSNMPVAYSRELERRHAFMAHFDGGVFSGDVRQIKPQPDIYATLAARHGLLPEQTLFIDDLAENLLPARALGWHVHHCTDATVLPSVVQAFLA
jgi:putative hydrolase of the HAD superfamily